MKNWIRKVLNQLKDKTNIIIFVIVFLVVSSPIWLCGVLGLIFKNSWLLTISAAYLALWLAPLTPFWMGIFAITFVIRKIVDKIRKRTRSKWL